MAYLTQGGTWANASDGNKKEDFTILNGADLLQKISALPITKWRYKGSGEYHIGPMAQDFHKTFGVGTDDKGISTVDPAGIALLAIQEQQKIIEKQHALILLLDKRIEALEKK
jgi:Chaperone of endosialidase